MKTTTTELNIRRADERGHADHGWPNSHYTFSFADYYDPAQMGFRSLRVINDVRVAPGQGFGTHPHRDMEIFSYVLEGAREPLRFLQIWIQPRERGLTPTYTEWYPKPEHAYVPKVLVISLDGRDGSATIRQDVDSYRILLMPGQTATHELKRGRGAWLQIAEGVLCFNGAKLTTGDGVSTDSPGNLTLTAQERTEAILFDLR